MARFIIENMEEIVAEWESFARIAAPASATMEVWELRDHAREMLEAIAKDIETSQSRNQQDLKSRGLAPDVEGLDTAATSHGILRHTVGFDLQHLVAEFRALRATVLRLWVAKKGYGDPDSVYEMTRFNEAIDQALAESAESYSKELSKSRDTFLAILGHDLRSPLSALAAALQILYDPEGEANRAEALAAGTRSVSAMGETIRDLLDYTRTRLGKGIPITPAQANLESVCKIAISEVSLVHPQTAFRLETGGKLDGTFDSARMHQVVTNLLNNAVQHGKRGAPVFLVARGEQGGLVLQVRNPGVQIAPEVLQVIFDPMVQVPAEGTGPPSSATLGLGLFIARAIVVAHGGKIEASCSAEDGTTFSVELPRVKHAAASSDTAPGLANRVQARSVIET